MSAGDLLIKAHPNLPLRCRLSGRPRCFPGKPGMFEFLNFQTSDLKKILCGQTLLESSKYPTAPSLGGAGAGRSAAAAPGLESSNPPPPTTYDNFCLWGCPCSRAAGCRSAGRQPRIQPRGNAAAQRARPRGGSRSAAAA